MIIEAKPENRSFAKFEKCINVLINDNSEYSIAPRCTFNLTQEQDCRRDFPDYNSLLQAHMNLQEDYSVLCKQNHTLWNVIEMILKFTPKTRQRLQLSKISHAVSLKRLKRDPMSIEIYVALLKASKGSSYAKIRLRVALCILFLTGVKLKVLLVLKVHQLTTLREKGWITIDHYGIESTDSKAHLTEIGRISLKERDEDFKSLFLAKTSNDFIFTSQKNPETNLRRETFTREINKVMSRVSHELPEKPNITSYSFRVGAITTLWQNPTVIKSIQKALDNN